MNVLYNYKTRVLFGNWQSATEYLFSKMLNVGFVYLFINSIHLYIS